MSYTAADITELDDVQHTRLRPAVNLGLDVLNTALREIIDNAVEEVADPSHGGSTVTITLHADGSVSVADDGRGLPVDSDPVNGKNGIVKTLAGHNLWKLRFSPNCRRANNSRTPRLPRR